MDGVLDVRRKSIGDVMRTIVFVRSLDWRHLVGTRDLGLSRSPRNTNSILLRYGMKAPSSVSYRPFDYTVNIDLC
jgi:hypothetical protein